MHTHDMLVTFSMNVFTFTMNVITLDQAVRCRFVVFVIYAHVLLL